MCHYLVIRSLLEAKEFTEAVQVINEFETLTDIDRSATSFIEDHSIAIDDAPKNVGYILQSDL